IKLDVARLKLQNGASISSSNASPSPFYAGEAGAISIIADDYVKLLDNSSLATEAESADGGNIGITAGNILYLLDSEITTSVNKGGGDGGNIDIDPTFVVLNNSRIIADAWGGDGGNISVIADYFIESADSIVSASSQFGLEGSIDIDSPQVDVTRGLSVLPGAFLDAGQWAVTPCAARSAGDASHLTFTGRDAAPTSLDDWLPSPPLMPDSLD
ncbi:MAG: hypothetical protein GY849_15810, partial [Deltaproteobacteria bacterium]|nr:hypothetical protein [Deltaproteobacteria bacterium]